LEESPDPVELKPDTVANIRHESPIFSLALSRDERLLACGGTDAVPITVWTLEDGACVGRFKGLKRQAHGLAFSPDGARLAAANLWGAQCVWSLGEGALLEEKEGGSGRQTRTLVYPASSVKHRLGHALRIDLRAGELVWYSMSGGRDGGAAVQTFESFLRDGPTGGSPPGPILREIAQAVRILSRERESDAKG